MSETSTRTGPPRGRPLDGVRILTVAEQYPGPFATLILTDLGADVIMVERPGGGDPTRRFSGHFAALNRGKRSVAIDLKSAEGVELFVTLSADADVVLEGFRPGVVDRLGIGAAALRARYPDLVYVSISSFGQFGPLSPRASHDLSSQGMAGFVTGEVPAPAPLPLADLASALYTVVGVVSSLFARGRGAGGAQIDVSMLDALIALRSTSLVSTLNGLDPAPYPPLDPGYGVFRFSGGRLMTLSIAGEDHQWRALCDVLGLPDLADLDTAAREADAERLRAALQDRIDRIDPDTLEQALEARGVGFGPVYDDHEVADDPHVRARRMVVTVEDDSKLRVVRQPLVFDGEPGSVARGVPALGQHSTEVLREAGLDDESIQSLMARGVVTSNERSNS